MFPISIKGEFRLRDMSDKEVEPILASVEKALAEARAAGLHRSGTTISFRGGLFRFVGILNILRLVGCGEITVNPGSPAIVRYRFSCVQMLVLTTILAGFFALALRSAAAPARVIFDAAIMWLILLGFNYITAALKLRYFVMKAATL